MSMEHIKELPSMKFNPSVVLSLTYFTTPKADDYDSEPGEPQTGGRHDGVADRLFLQQFDIPLMVPDGEWCF